jgi:hypothetical protein
MRFAHRLEARADADLERGRTARARVLYLAADLLGGHGVRRPLSEFFRPPYTGV